MHSLTVLLRLGALITLLVTNWAYAQESNQNEASRASALKEGESNEQYLTRMQAMLDGLRPSTGRVPLAAANATLTLTDDYLFLGPNDSHTVLVDIWGNPTRMANNLLGMVIPASISPFNDGAWGALIEYREEGYVSDRLAANTDYAEMLEELKNEVELNNARRSQSGHADIELVGWAFEPYYDERSHKLHWAQELKFGDSEVNTLNSHVRVLGRKGMLVISFVAGMDLLPTITKVTQDILLATEFDAGARYEDFQAGEDRLANYGLSTLLSGKPTQTIEENSVKALMEKYWWVVLIALMAALGVQRRRQR